MSSGGVFKLIANDGKADRMIMATKLLNQRVKDIELGGLTAAQLRAMHAHERVNKNRKTLLRKIDAQLTKTSAT